MASFLICCPRTRIKYFLWLKKFLIKEVSSWKTSQFSLKNIPNSSKSQIQLSFSFGILILGHVWKCKKSLVSRRFSVIIYYEMFPWGNIFYFKQFVTWKWYDSHIRTGLSTGHNNRGKGRMESTSPSSKLFLIS